MRKRWWGFRRSPDDTMARPDPPPPPPPRRDSGTRILVSQESLDDSVFTLEQLLTAKGGGDSGYETCPECNGCGEVEKETNKEEPMALHVLFDDTDGKTKQLVVPGKAVLIRIDEVGILQVTKHVDGYTEIRIQEPQGLATAPVEAKTATTTADEKMREDIRGAAIKIGTAGADGSSDKALALISKWAPECDIDKLTGGPLADVHRKAKAAIIELEKPDGAATPN